MRIYQIFVSLLTALLLLGIPAIAFSHPAHTCPDGFPEQPALSGHLEQADIVREQLSFKELFRAGKDLFDAVLNPCDGQGRPAATGTGQKRLPAQPAFVRTSAPDASSCVGCHVQPRSGGGGDFVANVFVLSQALDPVTFSIDSPFSNERNTLGMFGAGPIEMLAREMTAELHAQRAAAIQRALSGGKAVTVALTAKGVAFGQLTVQPDGVFDTSAVEGVDPDLIVKPFHQAGVVRSIREFSVNAFNHHHGMQAEERFDLNPATRLNLDFDEDGIQRELTVGDITAVTLFQAALATPGQVLPTEAAARQMVEQGEALFAQIGCTHCHMPQLQLTSPLFVEPNPLNPPGTFNDTSQSVTFDMTRDGELPRLEPVADGGALVRAYTDLKRHNLCDPVDQPDAIRFFCNERLAQGRPVQNGQPGQEFFLTRKLWDVGNSAPYGHRGDLTTISEAILYHGGEARTTRDAFVVLAPAEQRSIVRFLQSLQVLPPQCAQLVVKENDDCLRAVAL